jgi:hypothetical protein
VFTKNSKTSSSFALAFGISLLVTIGGNSGCSDVSDSPPRTGDDYLPISQPQTEEPPNVGEPLLPLANYDLAELGYQKHEFFMSGTANAFINVNEFLPDGFWEAKPADTAEYKTRVVTVRPINPAEFNGTVLVEWLSDVVGAELAPSWVSGHTLMLREGYVWVGVSVGSNGVLNLKASDPERFGSLNHPGTSFSYDIFSQVSEAIRNPSGIDILGGLNEQRIMALGQALPSRFLVTYVNAVHPLYNSYDGYLLSRRNANAISLSVPPQEPVDTPDVTRIRTDLNVPLMTVQSETELFLRDFVRVRQEDTDTLRTWEVTGASHIDFYTLGGLSDDGTDPSFAVVDEEDPYGCDLPINQGPFSWVFNAAIDALTKWVSNGIGPPNADYLAVSDDKSEFIYDEFGNVLGGIRTPYVDAPAAVLSGEGQSGPGLCHLSGTTELFDSALMASEYTDKAGYVQAVSDALDDAVNKGFLLPADAQRIEAAASLQWDNLGI